MDIPERHLITESDKGRIISNCFYCHKTPFCRETDDGWVTYCGNPDCEFKEKFIAPTRDESLCKWDDYIYYDLEHPGKRERIQAWKDMQELVRKHKAQDIGDEEYKAELHRLMKEAFKMVDNNEQDKIYLEYLALKQKADETWAQFVEWRNKLQEIDSQIKELDQYKKPYMVRVYKEVYYDMEVDGFNEHDAAEEAEICAAVDDWDTFQHFSSTSPRFKVLCLKEDYKEEMEEKDE